MRCCIGLLFCGLSLQVLGDHRQDVLVQEIAVRTTSVATGDEIKRLDEKMEASIRAHDEERKKYGLDPAEMDFPSSVGYFKEIWNSPCKYLQAAAAFIQSKHGEINKDRILIFSMWGLPFRDYYEIWAPAVAQGYLKGYVRRGEFVSALTPGPGGEFSLYYNEEPSHSFYTSFLRDLQMAEIPPADKQDIRKIINSILNGKFAEAVRVNAERGATEPLRPIDTKATCGAKRKGSR